MDKSHDEMLSESAKVIVSNILYHPEYREVLVTMLQNYQEVFQTRSLLRDLVATVHVYVRMPEVHCQQNVNVMTKERKKSGNKSHKKKQKQGVCGYVGGVVMMVSILVGYDVISLPKHYLVTYTYRLMCSVCLGGGWDIILLPETS